MMVKILLVALLLAASSAFGEIYTWRDSRGTAHYTNSLHEIPARYLKRAKVLDLGLAQKTDQAPVPPAGQMMPPLPAAQPTVQGVVEKPLQQNAAELQSADRSEKIRRLRDARQQERALQRRPPANEKNE